MLALALLFVVRSALIASISKRSPRLRRSSFALNSRSLQLLAIVRSRCFPGRMLPLGDVTAVNGSFLLLSGCLMQCCTLPRDVLAPTCSQITSGFAEKDLLYCFLDSDVHFPNH